MHLVDKFNNVKILVVGDVMIDKYLLGDVTRISPEAPVPVVKLTHTEVRAGGAANVAANIAGLGGKPFLIGVIGDDEEADVLPEVLDSKNVAPKHLVVIKNHTTTLKVRVMSHQQQIVRIDSESKLILSKADRSRVWQKIQKCIDKIDAIIISDYNKGFLDEEILKRLITAGKQAQKKIIIDPKGEDFSKYTSADIITPNKNELLQAHRKLAEKNGKVDIEEAAIKILKKNKLNAVLVTRGEEGMTLVQKNLHTQNFPAVARRVYDVTGAGDTSIAAFALAVGSGGSLVEAAEIANIAAGLAVEEAGTSVVKLEHLKKAIEN